ncbi:hypothetical protein [Shewanella sp. Isolate11]|uniref:hypothetical protein n=1 Tax=Shewanella sp. Isolate11 TaxID=2908530 RepID=UPI001EFCE1E5|nr:hypothetical protein [Shewanella sp. Isolate11]MCG9697124.1 hypothetical protein [Shewanella sp. Isolate11]
MEKLIPVNIQFSTHKDTITVNNETLVINHLNNADRQNLKLAVEQSSHNLLIINKIAQDRLTGCVKVFGQNQTLPFPPSLLAYIKGNDISLAQLSQLAMRPQGYPIGEVTINDDLVTVSSSATFKLQSHYLPNAKQGTFFARFVMAEAKLQLQITPKLAELNICLINKPGEMHKVLTNNNNLAAQSPVSDNQSSPVIKQPTQLASHYAKLNQQFASQSLSPKQLDALTIRSEASPRAIQQANHSTAQLTSSLSNQLLFQKIQSISTQLTLTNKPLLVMPAAQTNVPMTGTPKTGALNSTVLSAAVLTSQVTSANQSDQLMTSMSKPSPSPETPNPIAQQKSQSQATQQHRGLGLAMQRMAIKPTNNDSTSKQSLLSLIQRLQPLVFPRQLTELADPKALIHELRDSLTALNLTRGLSPFTPMDGNSSGSTTANSSAMSHSALTHSGTIGILFQLLLGRQQQTQHSSLLNQHLLQLQQKLAFSDPMLALLDKVGTSETLAKLFSGFTLYQQASSETAQANNWYFTLPYMLDNRHEQFEGHFEQPKQDEQKTQIWRLQLKFNLSQGAVLVNAEVNTNRLKLKFSSDNEILLNKIASKSKGLSKKIAAVGLVTEELTTHKANVPASLLPGEHYLVKATA